ncbi:MAG: UbiX family flavin prenyltransferase [Phycisphaerales bacterium]|nr:UbiX family flavin prenyltransferase [Phycisphaerales bacterium]
MNPECSRRIVVAITGASGAAYARRVVDQLLRAGVEVHLVVSTFGRRLLRDELGISNVSAVDLLGREDERLVLHAYKDVGSLLGSGSFRTDGMIVCPCSTHTFAAIAAGLGDNLINRAAAVTLKERRRLILVVREMPLTHIDLLNAVRLSDAGAIVCPASPGFYMVPRTLEDIVDFVAGKVLDLVGVAHELNVRWEKSEARGTW